jgi:hypothetical protein
MRPLLKDKNVISDCETQIKEYQKYIDYFTEELARIESKKELSPQLTPNLQPPRTSSMAHPLTAVTPIKTKYSNLGKCLERRDDKERKKTNVVWNRSFNVGNTLQ